MEYPTLFINAKPSDFGQTVIMPDDPVMSKFIADNFLTYAKLINNIRYATGYTGYYKGSKITVMASGMGMPSMGIYSEELFRIFDVERIIHVGTAGSIQPNVNIRDILIPMSAAANSSYIKSFGLPGDLAPTADFELLKNCIAVAKKKEASYHVGSILTSDTFYDHDDYLPAKQQSNARWADMGILGIDMETAALYANAMKFRKKAVAICTVTDHIITGERLSVVERERSLGEMIEIGLDTAFLSEM